MSRDKTKRKNFVFKEGDVEKWEAIAVKQNRSLTSFLENAANAAAEAHEKEIKKSKTSK